MGKERKKLSPRNVVLRGCLLSLSVYLTGILLASFLAVKGMLPENGVLPVLGILCGAAGLCGALPVVKNGFMGRVPAGLLSSALFACVLLIAGACIWQGGFSWSGSGGVLILCSICGGVLAAFLTGKRRRTGKRLRK